MSLFKNLDTLLNMGVFGKKTFKRYSKNLNFVALLILFSLYKFIKNLYRIVYNVLIVLSPSFLVKLW